MNFRVGMMLLEPPEPPETPEQMAAAARQRANETRQKAKELTGAPWAS